jgi:hypothetical protein
MLTLVFHSHPYFARARPEKQQVKTKIAVEKTRGSFVEKPS